MAADWADDPSDEVLFTYEADADESLSVAVISAVAAISGQPVDELEPLHETIDPDALDALFRAKWNNNQRSGRLSFVYYGYVVLVDGEGQIMLSEE